MKKNRIIKVRTLVPIYECVYRLVVAVNVREGVKRLPKPFAIDPNEIDENATGLAVHCGIDFAVILPFNNVCHNTIAHEVFHVTHRLMEMLGHTLKRQGEPHAYLNGWLHEWTMYQLRRAKVRVKI